MTALLEYLDLVLSDTGKAEPINKRGFLKSLETPFAPLQLAIPLHNYIIARVRNVKNEVARNNPPVIVVCYP